MELSIDEVMIEVRRELPEKGAIWFFTDRIDTGVRVLSEHSKGNVFCQVVLDAFQFVQKSYQDKKIWTKGKYRFPLKRDDVSQEDSLSDLKLSGEAEFMKFMLDSLDIPSSIFTSDEGYSLEF